MEITNSNLDATVGAATVPGVQATTKEIKKYEVVSDGLVGQAIDSIVGIVTFKTPMWICAATYVVICAATYLSKGKLTGNGITRPLLGA